MGEVYNINFRGMRSSGAYSSRIGYTFAYHVGFAMMNARSALVGNGFMSGRSHPSA